MVLSFRVFSSLVTWLAKYGRDLKISQESSLELTRAKSLSLGGLVFKI